MMDALSGARGYGGRDIRKVVHFLETSKPAPIVPKRLIRAVSERVDRFGEVVVSLNEDEAERAIRALIAEGVQELAPEVFITCSVDIAPK
jgi:N-methylhydantoinase A